MPIEISNLPEPATTTTELVNRASGLRREPILPESVRRPLVLIWVAVVPQVVLLLLNLRDYDVVSGEMTAWQKQMSLTIAAFELVLILGAGALTFFLKRTGGIVSWRWAAGLLAATILYLWFGVYRTFDIVPQSVSVWVLPPDQVVYDQFAFMMPQMFYAAVLLACSNIRISARAEWTITLSIAIGVPLTIAAGLMAPRSWRLFEFVPEVIIVSLFIGLTLVVFIGILRALIMTYVTVRRKGAVALGILSFLVGIAGPIAGLVLNRSIPFPSDFQSVSVYALALINGLLLLLPNFRHPTLHRTVWLLQCLLFPFTLYFFVVFLPFLPLSLIGILAMGAGFLILTPTALFLVHGQRLYDGYRNEIRDGGRLKPAVLGLVAISIIPAFYAAEAMIDRTVLRLAMDYVFAPNYRTSTHFEGSPRFVKRSLEHLRDSKAGLQLPFLSRFYNWMVFDGLVLPDDKMDQIHRAFLGTNVAPVNDKSSRFFGSSRPATRPAISTPPTHDVVLKKTSTAVRTDGDCHRATVTIEMQNLARRVSEFATTIDIPDGVLVSGFYLHIGTERVPGRVFEKKTALWVYQMIRDRTQRDPGILLFTNPNKLELRVFPFQPNENRQVEIEFLYPATLHPAIAVGDDVLYSSGENQPNGVVLTESRNTARVWLARDAVGALPKPLRAPYLHLIIDRSKDSTVDSAAIKHAINVARTQFPNAKECLITAANFEIKDLTTRLVPIESETSIDLSSLPRQGGFMAGRAIKRALLRYHDAVANASSEDPWLSRFPVFIVVQGDSANQIAEQDLSSFAKFAPDLPGYYVTSTATNQLEFHSLRDNEIIPAAQPVALLKLGETVALCRAVGDKPEVVDFGRAEPDGELTVFDPAAQSFVRLNTTTKIPATTQYAAGTALWQEYLDSIYNPSVGAIGLGKIVKGSRESGILVGATSYIVVENSAQWKMLERKQKQKLGQNIELEFEAVPEPETWCLIIFGGTFLVFLALRKRRSRA